MPEEKRNITLTLDSIIVFCGMITTLETIVDFVGTQSELKLADKKDIITYFKKHI